MRAFQTVLRQEAKLEPDTAALNRGRRRTYDSETNLVIVDPEACGA